MKRSKLFRRIAEAAVLAAISVCIVLLVHSAPAESPETEAPRTVVPVQRPITLAKGGSVEVPPAGIVSIVLKKS